MTSKKAKTSEKFVSVVMPAYKAEKFVKNSLESAVEVLDDIRYPYEIICVVDGKVDKTYEKAKTVSHKYPGKVKVVGYKTNLGKGHAVRFGMARAKGDIIGFIDTGFDLDPNGISMLLEHFEWYNADIIVGSKRHPVSKVSYPWQRRIISLVYQTAVRMLFGFKVKDTQVGMKFFRREVLEKTLPRLLVKAWVFDVEMLAVSYYLGFKRIYEAPVNIQLEFGGSSVVTSRSFIKFAWGAFIDTLAIFYRLRILHYYDEKNSKNWITPEYLTLNNKK